MLRCRLRGIWETVTMPEFWQSLISPPLIIVSGHLWPEESLWTRPVVDPEHGPIEYDASACVECGHIGSPLPWRRYYGQV